jgi:hypothetical protein
MKRFMRWMALVALLPAIAVMSSTCTIAPSGPKTITVYSNAANDGDVTSTGVVTSGDTSILVGDLNNNTGLRGFIDFVYSIPASATLTSATFYVYCTGTAGGDPVGRLGGGVIGEHLVYDTLDGTDYNAPAPGGDVAGTVTSDATTGWKTVDVTSHVQDDVWAALGRTQFRLYCPTDIFVNGIADYFSFGSGENATPPQLTITYE